MSVFAEMYKYIDENGQVVYTQFRPDPSLNAEAIKGPAPPPSTAKGDHDNLIENLVKQAENREDQKAASKKAEIEKAEEERKKKNCEAARKNLEYLQGQETGLDKRLLVDKDGKPVKMSAEDRQNQINEAKEVIEQDCK